ncbi:MAG TPA: LacI family DNA-binding transcriptional regulator [Erysipelotrichaceae bacterium]|nr:LacI family DNA-binding transcriptional regulator [Erysipelotrichaceae bacterium]
MKKVTIYEVAAEADVSLATVSRVINGSDLVKDTTRQRVEAAIEKLGYKPNAVAQSLALKRSTTIALVVPEASFGFTGQIINGLLDVAKIYNYNIYLHTITEGIKDIKEVIDTIIKSRVDGVVIYNDRIGNVDLEDFARYNIPIVFIGNKLKSNNISSVYVDIEMAIHELAQKFIDEGVSDISVLEDRKNEYAASQIVSGVKKAYDENDMEFDNFIEIPSSYRSSYTFLTDYFKNNKPEVIIANRDSQAIAVINAAAEAGYKIPEEMQVVCVIDTKYNKMLRPQLSSFAMPSYDLGAVAMRMMTKLLDPSIEEEEIEHNIELSYLYTPRNSTNN